MAFELPKLPYPAHALAPHISAETLEFHHGKHHAAYVNNLNNLVKGGKFENAALDEIIKGADAGSLFNNAGQHFNHCFYWNCMKPRGGGDPGGKLADAIRKAFGDIAAFKKKFSDAATTHFERVAQACCPRDEWDGYLGATKRHKPAPAPVVTQYIPRGGGHGCPGG